ncbi:MAG: LCP family protein [Microgenomates group bacterium]|nr:LCP family protein [Microgenomates group bacterium]
MLKITKKSLIIFIFFIFIGFILVLSPWYYLITKTFRVSLLKTLFSWNGLKKNNNQINFLILGIPGGNHDGPNLSDSILFANYNLSNNKITFISIPRDIWSPTLRDKINSAYAYGEYKKKGGGFDLAKAEIEAVVGQPIHYTLVIDFEEFKKLINFLGGIDVWVTNGFVDPKFPIPGKEKDPCNGDPEYKCRYETVRFNKGLNHMDGETALKFVRSRNAQGEEGNDFARGKRQLQVIEAIKNKIYEIIKTFDIKKITNLYKNVDQSIKKDINNQQLAILGKNIFLKGKISIANVSLPEDLFIIPLYSSEYDFKYVLIPKNNDFSKIHQVVDCFINTEENNACLNIKMK